MAEYIIGLTGGIGSGKTAASDWFATQGIAIVDADIIAREIVELGSPILAEIQRVFGDWVLLPHGHLDRPALRKYVFENSGARKELESITHPAIRNSICTQLKNATTNYAILVAPLLLEGGETGLKSLCQRVLVIDVPVTTQKNRAAARDEQNTQQIEAIMSSQISRDSRLAQAQDIVDNNKDLLHLYQQLHPLHKHYHELSQNNN